MSLLILNPYRFAVEIEPGDTGYAFGGTASEYQQSGWDQDWSNDSNILASSGAASTAALKAGDETTHIVASNFGFAVPAGATILSVHAQVNGKKGFLDGTGHEGFFRLFDGITNPIGSEQDAFSAWSTAARTDSYEPAASTWGASLTPAIVNSSDFGLGLRIKSNSGSLTPSLSWIKLKVLWG